MGRVSVSLCDECTLPFADKIDWKRCIVPVRQEDALEVGPIVEFWLSKHSDDEIIKMGEYARAMWKKWLWRDTWAENIGNIVREKLGI